MLGLYKEDILRVISVLEIAANEHPLESIVQVRCEVVKKFTSIRGIWERGWIWEAFVHSYAVQAPGSYKWVTNFLVSQQAILLFDPNHEQAMFNFSNGADIIRVVDELNLDDFYVTNTAIEYLLCYNHHEYLCACGTALSWLRNYVAQVQALEKWQGFIGMPRTDNRLDDGTSE